MEFLTQAGTRVFLVYAFCNRISNLVCWVQAIYSPVEKSIKRAKHTRKTQVVPTDKAVTLETQILDEKMLIHLREFI